MSHPLYSTLSSEIGFLLPVVCLFVRKSRMEWYRSKPARDKGGEINPKATLNEVWNLIAVWGPSTRRTRVVRRKKSCVTRGKWLRENGKRKDLDWKCGRQIERKKQRQEERRGCGERGRELTGHRSSRPKGAALPRAPCSISWLWFVKEPRDPAHDLTLWSRWQRAVRYCASAW